MTNVFFPGIDTSLPLPTYICIHTRVRVLQSPFFRKKSSSSSSPARWYSSSSSNSRT